MGCRCRRCASHPAVPACNQPSAPHRQRLGTRLQQHPGGPKGERAQAHGRHGLPHPPLLLRHHVVHQQHELGGGGRRVGCTRGAWSGARAGAWVWPARRGGAADALPAPTTTAPASALGPSPQPPAPRPADLEHDGGEEEGGRKLANQGGRLDGGVRERGQAHAPAAGRGRGGGGGGGPAAAQARACACGVACGACCCGRLGAGRGAASAVT